MIMLQSEYWKTLLGDSLWVCCVLSWHSNTDEASDLLYKMLFCCPSARLPGLVWPICSTPSYIYVFYFWHLALCSPACCVTSLLILDPFHLWKGMHVIPRKRLQSGKVTADGCLSRCVAPRMDRCHGSRMLAAPPSHPRQVGGAPALCDPECRMSNYRKWTWIDGLQTANCHSF